MQILIRHNSNFIYTHNLISASDKIIHMSIALWWLRRCNPLYPKPTMLASVTDPEHPELALILTLLMFLWCNGGLKGHDDLAIVSTQARPSFPFFPHGLKVTSDHFHSNVSHHRTPYHILLELCRILPVMTCTSGKDRCCCGQISDDVLWCTSQCCNKPKRAKR